MKHLLFIALVVTAAACSTDEEIRPLMSKTTIDISTAKAEVKANAFHLYLFGSDTLTLLNIIPNPTLTGVFDYDAIEGTPGKFKNSELFHGGKLTELLSAGRLTIVEFRPGDYINVSYDVTYRDGERVQGSYKGKITN